MPGPATAYRTADGWRWDGREWRDREGRLTAAPAVVEPARRRAQALVAVAMAALLLASVLALAGDAGRPAHRLEALTGPMAARGQRCAPSPLAHEPAHVWTCVGERRTWYEYVIAQFDEVARVDYLSADVGGLDLNAPDPPRTEAFALFRDVLGFAFADPATLSAARHWLDANRTGRGTARRFGRTTVTLSVDHGRARLDVAGDEVDREELSWYPMPHVNRDRARAWLRARGASCRPEGGYDYCEAHAPRSLATAGLFWSMAHPGRLTGLDVNLTGPAPAVAARQLLGSALGLVLTGDDLATARAWLAPHLDGRAHRTVVAGIDLTLRPISSDAGNGFDLHAGPAGWPGI